MNIVNIASKFKTAQLHSCGPERVVSFKLIVTVENGDDLIFVELSPDIATIEKEAFRKVIEKVDQEA